MVACLYVKLQMLHLQVWTDGSYSELVSDKLWHDIAYSDATAKSYYTYILMLNCVNNALISKNTKRGL